MTSRDIFDLMTQREQQQQQQQQHFIRSMDPRIAVKKIKRRKKERTTRDALLYKKSGNSEF